MTSSSAVATPPRTAEPPLRLVFSSLLRADFLVFLKHRRALVISMLLPFFVLVSTSGNNATDNFNGITTVTWASGSTLKLANAGNGTCTMKNGAAF